MADQYIGNWHIFRCPASPTHKRRLADGVVFYHPISDSQQKRRSIERQAAIRQCFGLPSPRRTIAVSTGEAYPKQRRVVKKQGDDLDKSGCSGYDLDAGSQDYAVYSACSN